MHTVMFQRADAGQNYLAKVKHDTRGESQTCFMQVFSRGSMTASRDPITPPGEYSLSFDTI